MQEKLKLAIQKYVGVETDGDIGPLTIKAIANKLGCSPDIKSIQNAVGVISDGQLGPVSYQAIATKFNLVIDATNVDRLISIANTQIGIHETSTNNGTGIEKYWTATSYPTGYKERQPYCAACQCWIAQQSQIFTESERPKSPAAFGWESWADDCKKVKVTRSPKKVYEGDWVIFKFSHIGLATSDSDSNGVFSTVEANTGASGGREGDGVYAKTRNISTVRSTVSLIN